MSDHEVVSDYLLEQWREIAEDLLEADQKLRAMESRTAERLRRLIVAFEEVTKNLDFAIKENIELRRGEFVCRKCGIRKDSEHERGDF